MPEYLAPGVFVEETSFRGRSIEGVGTSVAALIGPARTGPLRGVPEPVTSFNEFTRIFGDLEDLQYDDESTVLNYTALAARAFFDNGGKQLFVVRVASDVNSSSADSSGSRAQKAQSNPAIATVAFESRFPGKMGNYTLELIWRDSENLFSTEQTTAVEEGETVFLHATNVPAAAKTASATLDDASFPLSVNAVVRRQGDNYVIVRGVVTNASDVAVDTTSLDAALVRAALPAATTRVTRVRFRSPSSGELSVGDAVELSLGSEQDISVYAGVAHWGTLTVLRGTLLASAAEIDTLRLPAALNAGLSADLSVPVVALAALASGSALMVRRGFDLDVRNGGKDGEVVYRFTGLSTARGTRDSLDRRLPASPEKRSEFLAQPICCRLGTGDVLTALNSLFVAAAIEQPDPLRGARYLIELSEGSDGDHGPYSGDYGGEVDTTKGNTGLAALEDIEDVSIVLTPAASVLDRDQHLAVVTEVQKHCLRMSYRVGIVDARKDASISEVREFRNNLSDSRLALYYPWVVTADPTGKRDTLVLPPSGFIAGVYAGTDVRRGVHKPPANETVVGALRFNQEINRFQQELLNPQGINCLRSFPARGHRVWGARTLSTDPEWRYVNVRRYFLFLERSIEKSTQWAVFEPNGEALWANVRSAVTDFLYNEWTNGRLLGSTPKAAYFVRCDRSTMTQNDIDNGRLVCEVGVAPLRPAEFVIFRIGQKTADA